MEEESPVYYALRSASEIARRALTLSAVRNQKEHPDVGSAVWALSKLRAPEDAVLYRYVLDEKSGYGAHAHHQAKCAMEDITVL